MFHRLSARMRDLYRDLMAESLHNFAESIRTELVEPPDTDDPLINAYRWGQADGIQTMTNALDEWANGITNDKETTR